MDVPTKASLLNMAFPKPVSRVTTGEEDAKVRIQKAIKYQEDHDTYLVYEKKSGQTIGFAGVEDYYKEI